MGERHMAAELARTAGKWEAKGSNKSAAIRLGVDGSAIVEQFSFVTGIRSDGKRNGKNKRNN
jgi:hypothetical protein